MIRTIIFEFLLVGVQTVLGTASVSAQRLDAAPFQTQIMQEAAALLQAFSDYDSNAFIQRVHPRFFNLTKGANSVGKEIGRMEERQQHFEFTLTSPSFLIVKHGNYICTFTARMKIIEGDRMDMADEIWLAGFSDDHGKTWQILPLFTHTDAMEDFVVELKAMGLEGDTPHPIDEE